MLGSYSHSESNLPGTDADGAPIDTTPEGLSGDVASLTVYYERNGFEARIGQRYRSAFNALRHNAFRSVMDSIRPENITDFQIGYEFQTGQLKGLSILLQANNVFNEPYVVTQKLADGTTALKEYHEFGSQYLMGVTYKF
jgi:iron complex outermembrane receptor protein